MTKKKVLATLKPGNETPASAAKTVDLTVATSVNTEAVFWKIGKNLKLELI